jgi:hypothetical protein
MALKDTVSQMGELLEGLLHNLNKAAAGNRAAAQRVRTGSVLFARIAKVYRKESVAAEKGVKKSSKTAARKKK